MIKTLVSLILLLAQPGAATFISSCQPILHGQRADPIFFPNGDISGHGMCLVLPP